MLIQINSQSLNKKVHVHVAVENWLNVFRSWQCIKVSALSEGDCFCQQECIPVGCVPPAHWPYSGGAPAQGGLPRRVCPGGCTIWPIPSCIWCYLYAVLSPTETDHQCNCLYSVWSCDLWCMLGYHTRPSPTVDRRKSKTYSLLRIKVLPGYNILFLGYGCSVPNLKLYVTKYHELGSYWEIAGHLKERTIFSIRCFSTTFLIDFFLVTGYT